MRMRSTLRVGDWVEVLSKEEILATLDADGRRDGLPFMPEMFHFCGRRLQVQKRAHKSCDYTTHPFRSRRIKQAVLLDTRCDGSAHGGCQAGCTILWKEAWFKRVDPSLAVATREHIRQHMPDACSEHRVWNLTHVTDGDVPRYVCQATEMPKAGALLPWWDLRQYVEDYSSGNVSLGRLAAGCVYSIYFHISQAGIGVGPAMRWFYNAFRWIWRGSRFPRTPGLIPEGNRTPTATLNLQPGELVRVKSHAEILETVTTGNMNRGMHWDAELVPYCGGEYRVLKRVSQLIDEKNGRMLRMKTPGIVLDSVVCQARYSECRMFCPRAMYPYWREIWLERVAEKEESSATGTCS